MEVAFRARLASLSYSRISNVQNIRDIRNSSTYDNPVTNTARIAGSRVGKLEESLQKTDQPDLHALPGLAEACADHELSPGTWCQPERQRQSAGKCGRYWSNLLAFRLPPKAAESTRANAANSLR